MIPGESNGTEITERPLPRVVLWIGNGKIGCRSACPGPAAGAVARMKSMITAANCRHPGIVKLNSFEFKIAGEDHRDANSRFGPSGPRCLLPDPRRSPGPERPVRPFRMSPASRADPVPIVANLKLISKSRQIPPDRPGSRALLSQPRNVGKGHLAQSPRALCPCHPTTSGDPVSYHLRADCLSLPNCGEN